MAEELFKDIYMIKVPLPGNPLKNLNSYFIKGESRNLLIDTGFNMKPCYDAVMEGLRDVGADMEHTDIFLTHLHSDHTGLSTSIASENTRIYMGETDKELMIKFFNPEYWDWVDEIYYSLGFPREELAENKSKNPASSYMPSKGAFIAVKDGHTIDLGNYRLRCIETPGHTPGHMCLYIEEEKILFSGDHIIFDITPNIISWHGVEDSLGLYLKSLENIKKLEIEHTFSSHRKAIGDCHERIEELIRHHEDRVSEVERIVENSEKITTYQVASKMTWSIRAKNWSEFPVEQKWFATGEASAHLEYLRCRGVAEREMIGGVYFYSHKLQK